MIHRYEEYLRVLTAYPEAESIKLTTLLELLEEYSLKDVKTDLQNVGILIKSNSFRVDKAKWKIRHYLQSHSKNNNYIRIDPLSETKILSSFKGLNNCSANKAVLREKAYKYFVKKPEDSLLCLSLLNKNKVAFKHQIDTVQKLINNLDDRGIVSDEVGLGKTITALLWIHEHFLRANRELNCLVLVPSNLKKQWCDAFYNFFGLPFSYKKRHSVHEIESQDILLLSIDSAKIGDTAKVLMNRYWDCLVVDESHEIRNMDSLRFKFVYSLNASYKLFLSATPVQNTAYDLYSQSLPLEPGLLDHKKQFGDYYLEDERRVKNPLGLQKVLDGVVLRTRRDDIPFEFAKRNYHTELIREWTDNEYEIYDDLLNILIGVFHKQLPKAVMLKRQSGGETAIADFVLKCMLLLREMASHPDAAVKTISKSLYPEIKAYAFATKDYTFEKRLRLFVSKYKKYKNTLSKEKYLLDLISKLFKRENRRAIIFVNFLKTRDAIKDSLSKRFPDIDIYEFYGELPKNKKNFIIESFGNSPLAVLISTDSGGQGLNLDVADVVINYDYPWNPMKVEQRIGRIDRLSKKYNNIYIYNLITSGTIEQYVYQTLIEKIGIVKDVIGDIMSPIEIEEEWERRFMVSIGLIVLSCKNSTELKKAFEMLDKTALSHAATQYRTLIFDRYRHGLD